jgi:outer membrane assembly lipoprotein YfiO
MNRWSIRLFILLVCVVGFPFRSPAPFVYTPGEGWTYEPVGGDKNWQQSTARDQLGVAKAAFDKKEYSIAYKAAKRVVRVWDKSDYVPQAQYLAARCQEEQGKDEKAFKEYQKLIEKYPKIDNYQEVLQRQAAIADKYLAGKWFKLWGVIPFFPSMDKTADMYTKIVKNGPYSTIAPTAQMNIGKAREKQKDYPLAVKAYETAADRYHDRPEIAADAIYRAGVVYDKQAKTAEYDQTTAGQAINTFTDFMTLYPNDKRTDDAQKKITSLKLEQARGNYQIARFYEKHHKWNGALVYYNEVLVHDPNSPYATQARERIDALKAKTQPKT